jgi:AraC-like DNA-binding protein
MQLARAQCERELAALVDAGFPGRVRAAIAGDGADGADAFRHLGEVATRLHVSTRTLKRRLAEHGTTFSEILDDMRRQRALLLLENRELAIGEVAARLGYTEVPNFTRAFRRWTGKTPAAYRGR